MATLADYIYTTPRVLTHAVRVNGVLLRPADQASGLAELAGVPAVTAISWNDATAEIRVNRCPSWMRAGQRVTIDAGFNGLTMRVFTGSLVALPGEDPDYLRSKVIVRGATVQVGTPPDDVPVELTATATLVGADIQPPLPEGTHIEHEINVPLVSDSDRLSEIAVRELGRYGVVPRRPNGAPNEQTLLCGGELYKASRAYQLDAIDLSGFTDEDAINLICDLVGITKRDLIEPPGGWYTLDVGAQVRRGRPLDMLAELMVIGGLEAYHTEDGTVIFRQVEFAPGPSHAWEYDVTDQDLARIIQATGELQVTFNPFVRKFSTGLINIPFLNFNSERVFVRGVRHELSPSGAWTYIDAWGGSRLGGTIAIDPIAAFTFLVEREVFGDATYLIYTCDASSSFDPDGSIASYAWTCNRATLPASLPATKVITFRVAADVATPLTLTLTVTDNDGNTHAVSIDLPTSADAPEMQIPAIFAALETALSATPDGGLNWNDITGLTGDEVSVDAKPADGVNSGIACYGYSDGSIRRTTDFGVTSTQVKAAAGADGVINEIWWDKNVTTRVWACTSTGRLYRSANDGVTWVLHKDFGGTYPLYRIATPIPKGVWVFGGRGDQPATLIQYEADVGSGLWQSVAVGGHLAADLAGAASSVHVRSAASRVAGELAILLNGPVPGGVNYFYTATVFDPAGAGWQRGTGSLVGDTDGREVVPDQEQGTFRVFFGDRSVHSCTDGIAFTEAANVLPAGFVPNRVLWLGDYTGHARTYLIAAEDAGHTGAIYKWLATEATADELRPSTAGATWPASADGRAIAIGAQRGTVAALGTVAFVVDGSPSKVYVLRSGAWSSYNLPAGITNTRPRLYCVSPTLWFVADSTGFGTETAGGSTNSSTAARSTDGGVTWSPCAVGDEDIAAANPRMGLTHFVRAAGGRIWAMRQEGNDTSDPILTRVYYSDNDGATWTASAALTAAAPDRKYPLRLIAHPTNENIIAALVSDEDTAPDSLLTYLTVNNGASWSGPFGGTDPSWTATGDALIGFNVFMLTNGRLVMSMNDAGFGAPDTLLYTSDDNGQTWTLRQTIANTDHFGFLCGVGPNKIVLFRPNVASAGTETHFAYISTNGGVTYTQTGDSLPAQANTGNNWSAKYDYQRDTLYVLNGNDATGAGRVWMFTPVTADGEWTDITSHLPNTAAAWDALSLVPGS